MGQEIFFTQCIDLEEESVVDRASGSRNANLPAIPITIVVAFDQGVVGPTILAPVSPPIRHQTARLTIS